MNFNSPVMLTRIDMTLFIIRVNLHWYEIDEETRAESNHERDEIVYIFLNPQSAKIEYDNLSIGDFMGIDTQERTEYAMLTLEKWNVDESNSADQIEVIETKDLLV